MVPEPLWSYQLKRSSNIVYEDIFSEDITKQAAVTKLFSTQLERREEANYLTVQGTLNNVLIQILVHIV